jgi:hypothetical protein
MTAMSARSRRPVAVLVSIAAMSARLFAVEHRRAALRHDVLGPAHRVCRIDLDDLADHQPVEKHAQRREMLFDRGLGQVQLLDVGGDVRRLHRRERSQPAVLAPAREPAGRMEVRPTRVRATDMGGEEPEEPVCRLRVGQKQRGPRVAERRERGRRLLDGEGAGRSDGHGLALWIRMIMSFIIRITANKESAFL